MYANVWISHDFAWVTSHMSESRHTYWMSRNTFYSYMSHVNEPHHMNEGVMSLVWIAGGRLVEVGRHEELLELRGVLQYVVALWCCSELLQCVVAVCCCNVLSVGRDEELLELRGVLQYVAALWCCSVLLQCVVAVCCYNVLAVGRHARLLELRGVLQYIVAMCSCIAVMCCCSGLLQCGWVATVCSVMLQRSVASSTMQRRFFLVDFFLGTHRYMFTTQSVCSTFSHAHIYIYVCIYIYIYIYVCINIYVYIYMYIYIYIYIYIYNLCDTHTHTYTRE